MDWHIILTIIGTGITILGVMIPLLIHLSNKIDTTAKGLNDKIDTTAKGLNDKVDDGFKEVHKELYSINGRLSHIEGQLNPLKIVPFEKPSSKKAKGES